MLNSFCIPLIRVDLPFLGRRKYMHTFDTHKFQMAEGFGDYGPIVYKILRAVGYKGVVHMTVDEKVVEKGMSQRRPDAHVDGRFENGSWRHDPGWLHYCNELPLSRMPVIVAASVPGTIVYEGKFEGHPQEDGDLEHIRNQFKQADLLCANKAFYLSRDCVHESLVFDKPTQRTFLRLALEND